MQLSIFVRGLVEIIGCQVELTQQAIAGGVIGKSLLGLFKKLFGIGLLALRHI